MKKLLSLLLLITLIVIGSANEDSNITATV